MLSKLNLRHQLLSMRRQVADQELRFATREATKRVLQTIDWASVERVHIYTARLDWHEIGTKQLIDTLRATYPQLIIETTEARPDVAQPTEQYDVIVMPVLGFDEAGYRIGLGRGWYDKFLATQPNAYKIGIAYSWAKRKRIPHEAHDVPLNTIIAI